MKLLTKTSLLLITVTLFIFFIGNIAYFQVIKRMINQQVETELASVMHKVIKIIRENPEKNFEYDLLGKVKVEQIESNVFIPVTYKDTMLLDEFKKQFLPYKTLELSLEYQNRNYKIQLYKSLLESNTLIERITIASLAIILSFIFSIFLVNRFIFVKVWNAFLHTLKQLEQYDIKKLGEIHLKETEISEFDRLNKVLISLINRIKSDYINLKQLTENTSHEIQTPVAIIKNKAEILLQSTNLNEKEFKDVAGIIQSADRLSKLNQSLLLIAKIENNQFTDSKEINLKTVVEQIVENLSPIYEAKEIKINSQLKDKIIHVNPTLIEVLILNLVKNAVIHSEIEGDLFIYLDEEKFFVKNTGDSELNKNEVFKRYANKSNLKNSSGLGLAITKKISDFYNFEIGYSFDNKLHKFQVDFI